MDFQKVYGYLIGYRHQMSLKNAVMSANGQFIGTQAHTALYDAMATAELLIMTTSKEEFTKRTRSIRELLAPPKKCCTTIGELYGAQLARFMA
jgi:inhibitor of KinA sporulation pathway (predicted exonuclease)